MHAENPKYQQAANVSKGLFDDFRNQSDCFLQILLILLKRTSENPNFSFFFVCIIDLLLFNANHALPQGFFNLKCDQQPDSFESNNVIHDYQIFITKKDFMKKISISCLAILLIILPEVVLCQYTTNNSIVYNLFRENQFNFPQPKPLDTIIVGRYDFAGETFEGLKSISIPNGHGGQLLSPYNVKSECFQHMLKFRVDHFNGSVVIKINDKTFSNLNGSTDIYLPLQQTPHVQWQISAGNQTYSDKFNILRLHFFAAGSFSIPIVPIVVVYEPPMDQNGLNNAQYSETKYANSSFGLSFSTENSQTTPGELSTYDNFTKLLGFAANVMAGGGDLKNKIPGIALAALAKAFGDHTVTVTEGTIRNNRMTINTEAIQSNSYNTSPNNGGPGIGDMFVCLIKPRFLWQVYDDKIYTMLLDFEKKQLIPAAAVKDSMRNGANKDVYASVAVYDPFIARGPDVLLHQDRFTLMEVIDLSGIGGSTDIDLEHRISKSDTYSGTRYNSTTDDVTAGMLSFTGWIPNAETKKVITTVTNNYTKEVDSGTIVHARVSLYCSTDEHKVYQVYYDNIFGTFAVREAHNTNTTPTQTGILKDTRGNYRPNAPVTITAGKIKYFTYTNSKGQYSFYSPELKNTKTVAVLKMN